MTSKIAIIIFADTNTIEAMGPVSNAFIPASESAENSDDLIYRLNETSGPKSGMSLSY